MKPAYFLLALAGFLASPVFAQSSISAKQLEVMDKLLVTYAEKAKIEAKEEKGRGATSDKPFSAEAGRQIYLKRRSWQSHNYACATCHTDDPKKDGKHIESKKLIKPLAPSANPERFVDIQKIEKSFVEHCMDLYDRDCLAHEKGNFIAYLKSVK
jgi:cytochrome c peroxidase